MRRNSASNVSSSKQNQSMLYTTYMPIQHVHHSLNNNNTTTNNNRCLSPQLTTNCGYNINDITFNNSNSVMPYFTYENNVNHLYHQQQQHAMLSPTITKDNLNMFYTKKDCSSNSSTNNNNIRVNSKNYIEKEKFLPSNSIHSYAKYNLIDFYMGQSGYVNYIPPLQQIQVNHIQNYYQQIPYSLGNGRKF